MSRSTPRAGWSSCVVPGERTAENVAAVVEDVKRRTGGRLMDLITSDAYPAYEEAILNAYGEEVTPPRTGKRGRPQGPIQGGRRKA